MRIQVGFSQASRPPRVRATFLLSFPLGPSEAQHYTLRNAVILIILGPHFSRPECMSQDDRLHPACQVLAHPTMVGAITTHRFLRRCLSVPALNYFLLEFFSMNPESPISLVSLVPESDQDPSLLFSLNTEITRHHPCSAPYCLLAFSSAAIKV